MVNLSSSLNEKLENYTVKKFYKLDISKKPTLGAVSRTLDIAPYVVIVKTGKLHNKIFCNYFEKFFVFNNTNLI